MPVEQIVGLQRPPPMSCHRWTGTWPHSRTAHGSATTDARVLRQARGDGSRPLHLGQPDAAHRGNRTGWLYPPAAKAEARAAMADQRGRHRGSEFLFGSPRARPIQAGRAQGVLAKSTPPAPVDGPGPPKVLRGPGGNPAELDHGGLLRLRLPTTCPRHPNASRRSAWPLARWRARPESTHLHESGPVPFHVKREIGRLRNPACRAMPGGKRQRGDWGATSGERATGPTGPHRETAFGRVRRRRPPPPGTVLPPNDQRPNAQTHIPQPRAAHLSWARPCSVTEVRPASDGANQAADAPESLSRQPVAGSGLGAGYRLGHALMQWRQARHNEGPCPSPISVEAASPAQRPREAVSTPPRAAHPIRIISRLSQRDT
jgi:hypothetical protein